MNTLVPKRTTRSFKVGFKLEVVEYAEKVNSSKAAGSKFNVSERVVSRWRKNKEFLQSLPETRKKMSSTGDKPLFPDLEKELALWVTKQRLNNVKIFANDIHVKALELASRYNFKRQFFASKWWITRFCRRHSFCLRQCHREGLRPLPDLIEVIELQLDSEEKEIQDVEEDEVGEGRTKS